MYVTRRLLRSTLAPEGADASQEEHTKPIKTQTPKTRAGERATEKKAEAKVGRITTNWSTENAGDEKNKRRHKKQKEGQEKPQEPQEKLFGLERMVDVRYNSQYIEARVVQLDVDQQRVYVHYMGWNARYDAWVASEDVVAHGSESGAKKKELSWDGETPLFATCEEAEKLKLSRKKTVKSRKLARKAQSNAEPVTKERKRRGESEEQPAKKIVRKSPKSVKAAKSAKAAVKATAKSPRTKNAKTLKHARSPKNAKSPKHAKKAKSPKDEKDPKNEVTPEDEEMVEQVAKSPRVRRNSRCVQVAVGTTDEASESTKESEAADLVLDVEIEDRGDLNEEPDAEEQEESIPSGRAKRAVSARAKSKRKRQTADDDDDDDEDFVPEKKVKEPKRGGSGSKSATASGMALPPHSGHGGLSSPMRKKLQQVFRQRVQEREQMEQLNASQTGFQESLQAEADDAASTEANSSSPTSTKTKSAAASMVSPTAGADEYQRQLQQYYYHQQVMLASSLAASMTGGSEDFSSVALQNGIMDPRIIQERLNALEERRRQQAQIQAYYQQLMLTRERNVRAMAANQAFMNASAAVWEQQLRECTQSEDSASVKSWKDVAEPSTADKETPETSKNEQAANDAAPSDASADASKSNDNAKITDNTNSNDNDSSNKESEPTATSNNTSTHLASPDTVEKTAESSTQSTPAKSKSDPDTSESVLYEFIL